jgi:hypothetical protein
MPSGAMVPWSGEHIRLREDHAAGPRFTGSFLPRQSGRHAGQTLLAHQNATGLERISEIRKDFADQPETITSVVAAHWVKESNVPAWASAAGGITAGCLLRSISCGVKSLPHAWMIRRQALIMHWSVSRSTSAHMTLTPAFLASSMNGRCGSDPLNGSGSECYDSRHCDGGVKSSKGYGED